MPPILPVGKSLPPILPTPPFWCANSEPSPFFWKNFKNSSPSMTYSCHLRDHYTSLNAQTLGPKKHFSIFFQLYFNKKYVEIAISDFTVNPIISKWLRTKMQTEEKNNETRQGRSERRNCLRKCFHSFKYVVDHANVCFFF